MKLFRLLIASVLAFVAATVAIPAQKAFAAECYSVKLTIYTTGADAITWPINVSFSHGNPFDGSMVLGPSIGYVTDIPANSQKTFVLSGSWDEKPDNVVLAGVGNTFTGSSYIAGVSSCGSGSTAYEYTLPGLPTNSHQGFVLPPAAASEDDAEAVSEPFELWLINDEGKGYKALELTQEFLEALETPEFNEMVIAGEGYAFYVLFTGEFQVNLGPTADGWYDVIVFNRDFEVTNTYRTR